MSHLIRIAAALSLIIAAGLVHGSWTSRWRPASALVAVAERLKTLPLSMDAWIAIERELPTRQLRMTGAVGYLSRRYHHSTTGLNVSVWLLSGLPGDISTHTPETCYPGAGYTLEASHIHICKYGASAVPAEFRTAVARKGGVDPSIVRIYWGWRSSRGWSAPEDPRWAFGTESVLSKLYVVREASDETMDPKGDPCGEFLPRLLTELDRVVFSSEVEPAAGPSAASSAR
jgi:hypothetical protein